MNLVNFLLSALPWLNKNFLMKRQNSGLLKKLENLAYQMTSIDHPGAYNKIVQDPQLLLEYQKSALSIKNEYMKFACKDRIDARKRDLFLNQKNGKNYRADRMIYLSCAGLMVCVSLLALYRRSLSTELIGIMSATVNVFGSCLKDAYVFEFGQGKTNALPENRENFDMEE